MDWIGFGPLKWTHVHHRCFSHYLTTLKDQDQKPIVKILRGQFQISGESGEFPTGIMHEIITVCDAPYWLKSSLIFAIVTTPQCKVCLNSMWTPTFTTLLQTGAIDYITHALCKAIRTTVSIRTLNLDVLLVMPKVLFIEPQTLFLGKSVDLFPKKC